MSPPRVVGLDLSLRATGLATPDGNTVTLTPKCDGCEWLAALREGILGFTRHGWMRTASLNSVTPERTDTDFSGQVVGFVPKPLVVIEDYAYSRGNQAHQIGELGGVIRLALHEAGVPYVVVGTGQLKKYATGKGNADKAAVILAAYKRFGVELTDDNQADALWLRAMGLDALGHPVCAMPAANRAVLDKVDWSVAGGTAEATG